METTAVFEDSIDLTRLTAPGLVLDVAGGGEGIVGKVLGRRVVSIDLSLAELQEASNDALKMVATPPHCPFLTARSTRLLALSGHVCQSTRCHRCLPRRTEC